MKTIMMVAVAVLALAGAANAQSATQNASPTWSDVQRACGGEWRAKDKASRTGTWFEFLNECKVRKGFVSKRNAGRAVVTLPDVVKPSN